MLLVRIEQPDNEHFRILLAVLLVIIPKVASSQLTDQQPLTQKIAIATFIFQNIEKKQRIN